MSTPKPSRLAIVLLAHGAFLLTACAGNDLPQLPMTDGGGGTNTCTPSCAAPLVCVSGSCVDPGACTGECTPGEMRDLGACGNCGRQVQLCGSDCRYQPSACSSEGECAPGVEDTQMEMCPDGETRTRSRQCSAACAWGDYGDWAGCTMTMPECTSGDSETRMVGCTNMGQMGMQNEERQCVDGSWGNWSPTGSCVVTGETDCTPGQRRTCPSEISQSQCVEQVCNADGEWPAECELKETNEDGAAVQCDHTSDSGVRGGRWRCCGTDSWQFCLSDCRWSAECASGCGCGCS